MIGAVTGAAAALTFAPQSDKGARKLIANKTRRGVDQGSKAVQKAAARGVDVVQRARKQAAEAVETGKKAYSRAASSTA